MRILLIHGAFDFKSDPKSALETLAVRLRGLGHDVDTINSKDDFLFQYDGVVGYSNGADTAVTRITKSKLNVRLLILLDPVWKNVVWQYFRWPFNIPRSVKACFSWVRRDKGWPKNSVPNRDEILFVDLDHGKVPFDEDIRDRIVQLFQGASL